jgi:3-hydroxyisobutyrate dehydrogenase/2-hydroxy-3-oxopropionate reductase
VAGLRDGAVVVETSTVSPQTVRALAPSVSAAGGSLLDAPVSGSVPVVERGELTVLVGGDAAALDTVRPVLGCFASKVLHLGPVGAGATMKLVVNGVVHAINQAVSEGLVLAEKAGVGRRAAYEVFTAGAAAAPYVQYKKTAFEDPEGTPVAFRLDLVAKDLALLAELAAANGARMDQADTNRRVVGEALAAGYSDRDISAIAAFLRAF